jgi:hypothetical protein
MKLVSECRTVGGARRVLPLQSGRPRICVLIVNLDRHSVLLVSIHHLTAVETICKKAQNRSWSFGVASKTEQKSRVMELNASSKIPEATARNQSRDVAEWLYSM